MVSFCVVLSTSFWLKHVMQSLGLENKTAQEENSLAGNQRSK
jgi:hypothetical protein